MPWNDFFVACPKSQLGWIQRVMKEEYETKSQVLGPEAASQREIRILNRSIRWTTAGIEYEPDQRHSDAIVKELGLEGAKSLSTPGTPEEGRQQGR